MTDDLKERHVECLPWKTALRQLIEQRKDEIDRIDSLEREVERLRKACLKAADAFRWYERLHLDKGPHAAEKAKRNRLLAEQMEAVLKGDE